MSKTVGTIVTGAPRTGTTLAFALSSSLSDEENNQAMEPSTLPPHIGGGHVKEAENEVRRVIDRFGSVKSPALTFILPSFEPIYDVILTFRDFRMFFSSIIKHKNSISVIGEGSAWRQYAENKLTLYQMKKVGFFKRALLYFETAYLCAVRYKGPMRIWNYGFWEDWVESERSGEQFPPLFRGASERVVKDLAGVPRFSDASFNLDIWQKCKAERGLGDKCEPLIDATHSFLKQQYAARGLILKTLDDK